MSFCSLIKDVATVDFLLPNLLPTFSIKFCVFDRFLKDSELLGHSIQPPVVNHRGGFVFWYLLIHSIHPKASDTCNCDKTEAGIPDDSIHRLHHTVALDERTVSNRIRSWLGASTLGPELPSSHESIVAVATPSSSPSTLLNATFWDASRHRLGQPSFAPPDDINEACLCPKVVQKARDCEWSKVQRCWRLVRFLQYQRNCSRTHSSWPHRILHQLFQRLVLHCIFHFGHHISHRFQHLKYHAFPFQPRPSIGDSSFLCSPRLHIFIIWSTCSSPISICGCVSHKCW